MEHRDSAAMDRKMVNEGIYNIALSDTIGIATPEQISSLYPA
jgi:hydroxymethylglutaryl-CoA lyase